MSRPPCEPLRITARLLDGRVNTADGLIFLDAILYHAWFLIHAPGVLDGTQRIDNQRYIGLPLKQLLGNRWAASCGFYAQHEESIEYWNKRVDYAGEQAEYLDAKGKINATAGQFKAYHMPNVIRLIGDVEFYAVGRPEAISEMLHEIPALGKKPAAGWGAVREWVVEPWHADWSTLDDAGRLMRPMPIDEVPAGANPRSYIIRSCGIKPPYWKHINQTVCAVPNMGRDYATDLSG